MIKAQQVIQELSPRIIKAQYKTDFKKRFETKNWITKKTNMKFLSAQLDRYDLIDVDQFPFNHLILNNLIKNTFKGIDY